MSCNPCCCLKLKDAAISIGIWSTIYSIMQLAIFGWQMAAIKYEKDRAANTLLPNYNTYGRYDIPTYYESYWQSPEERYYTWLFVIQILCLIAAFFLLFASLMMIYGIHTWSRFLLVPWMVTMCASILTSFAYCLIWWAGDVRDYWLLLTIVQMFGVFLNSYCFLVVIVFHRRMLVELEYYARRRKYDRFSRLAPQKTVEREIDANGEQPPERNRETLPYKRAAPANQLAFQSIHQPEFGPQMGGQFGGEERKHGAMGREMHTTAPQKTPTDQQRHETDGFREKKAFGSPHILPPHRHQIRSLSALEGPMQRPNFDEYREVPRRDKRKRQKSAVCRACDRDLSAHRFHCCHASRHCHCHRHSAERHRHGSLSSTSSNSALGEYSVGEWGQRPSRKGRRRGNKGSREWADRESDFELGHTVQSERGYGNVESLERRWRRQSKEHFPSREEKRAQQSQSARGRTLRQPSEGPTTNVPDSTSSTLARVPQQILARPPTEGISIPQNIVIPPVQLGGQTSETLRAERKYCINSEITVSYDPRANQWHSNGPRRENPPEIPPRIPLPERSLSPHSAGYINLSANAAAVSAGRREQRQQLIPVQSSV